MTSLQLFRILNFNQNYLKGSTFGRYIGKPNYVTEIYCNTFKCFRVNQSAISQFICYRPVQHKIYKLMKLNICQFLPFSDLDFRTVLTVWYIFLILLCILCIPVHNVPEMQEN